MLLFQPHIEVTLVNPQKCIGYFTISLPMYDGDTVDKVVDRVRRINGVSGKKCRMEFSAPPNTISLNATWCQGGRGGGALLVFIGSFPMACLCCRVALWLSYCCSTPACISFPEHQGVLVLTWPSWFPWLSYRHDTLAWDILTSTIACLVFLVSMTPISSDNVCVSLMPILC